MLKRDLIKLLNDYPNDWPVIVFTENEAGAHVDEVLSLHANGNSIQLNAISEERHIELWGDDTV